jgi:hypothetical protein
MKPSRRRLALRAAIVKAGIGAAGVGKVFPSPDQANRLSQKKPARVPSRPGGERKKRVRHGEKRRKLLALDLTKEKTQISPV